jgi:hypothetical protein
MRALDGIIRLLVIANLQLSVVHLVALAIEWPFDFRLVQIAHGASAQLVAHGFILMLILMGVRHAVEDL